MSHTTHRLIFAATVSAFSIGVTQYWYKYMGNETMLGAQGKSIATVISAENDVDRKPAREVTWDSVTANFKIYPGETIRTGDDSRAIIEHGGEISLGPNSMVVIEENTDGKTLELLSGSLFVKKGDIKVKAGDIEIGIGGNDASVNKKLGNVNFQATGELTYNRSGKIQTVASGKAVEISGDKLRELKIIEVVSPEPAETVIVGPEKPVEFRWKPISKEYDVILELGRTENKFEPFKKYTANGESGILRVPLRSGYMYWRLQAVDKKGTQEAISSLSRPVKVIRITPPALVYPEKDEQVILPNVDTAIAFKWSSPSTGFDSYFIEVAKTQTFNNKVLSKQIDDSRGEFSVSLREVGDYYWRVTGYASGLKEPVVSKQFKFSVSLKVLPPQLIFPENDVSMFYPSLQKQGLTLNWQNVSQAEKYQLFVEYVGPRNPASNEPPQVMNVQKVSLENQYRLNDLKPGNYRWWVSAVTKNGELSQISEKRKFTIKDFAKLAWLDVNKDDNVYYITEAPSVKLNWESGPAEVSKWRVRLSEEGQEIGKAPWLPTSSNNLTQTVAKPGRYLAQVEALDVNNEVVGQSAERKLNVLPLPLLPPPQLKENFKGELEAKADGSVALVWKPVEGAKEYIVHFKDGAKLDREFIFKKTEGNFKNLMPGKYMFSMETVDEFGRRGPASESKDIRVPDTSAMSAPKLKNLRVR